MPFAQAAVAMDPLAKAKATLKVQSPSQRALASHFSVHNRFVDSSYDKVDHNIWLCNSCGCWGNYNWRFSCFWCNVLCAPTHSNRYVGTKSVGANSRRKRRTTFSKRACLTQSARVLGTEFDFGRTLQQKIDEKIRQQTYQLPAWQTWQRIDSIVRRFERQRRTQFDQREQATDQIERLRGYVAAPYAQIATFDAELIIAKAGLEEYAHIPSQIRFLQNYSLSFNKPSPRKSWVRMKRVRP